MPTSKLIDLLRTGMVVWLFLYLCGILSFDGSSHVALLDRDLNADQAVGAASNSIKIMIWLTALGLSGMLAWANRSRWKRMPTILWPLALLLIYAGFSTFWSDYPDLTIKRVFFQVVMVATVVFLAASFEDEKQFLRAVTAAGVAIILVQLAVLLLFPRAVFDVSNAFVGFQRSKNNSGAIAAIFAVHFFLEMRQATNKKAFRFQAILTVGWTVILLASQSKSSIACAGVIILTSLFSPKLLVWVMRAAVAFVGGAYLYITLKYLGSGKDLLSVINEVFGDISLTGRVQIWRALATPMEKEFFLGHGYGAFWGVGTVNPDIYMKWSFISALNSGHNGYIDLTLTLGFVGALIFLIWIILIACQRADRLGPLTIAVLTITAIHNITESSYLRDTHIMWFTLLFTVAASSILTQPGRFRRQQVRRAAPLSPRLVSARPPAASRPERS